MTNRLLLSVAAALIAGTGLAHAQGAGGMGRDASPSSSPAARSAPGGAGGGALDRAAPLQHSAPAAKDEATDTTNKSDQRQDMKAQSDDKMERDTGSKSASDNSKDAGKTGKGMNDSTKSSSTETRSTTTGQAGAGAKLTTEQRTKVTTVIRQQNVKPVTNVNFSISVGTRVPRDVEFHPVPAEIVTVYPAWRGYNFILVNGQIIIIDPGSYDIVAVIDA